MKKSLFKKSIKAFTDFHFKGIDFSFVFHAIKLLGLGTILVTGIYLSYKQFLDKNKQTEGYHLKSTGIITSVTPLSMYNKADEQLVLTPYGYELTIKYMVDSTLYFKTTTLQLNKNETFPFQVGDKVLIRIDTLNPQHIVLYLP